MAGISQTVSGTKVIKHNFFFPLIESVKGLRKPSNAVSSGSVEKENWVSYAAMSTTVKTTKHRICTTINF